MKTFFSLQSILLVFAFSAMAFAAGPVAMKWQKHKHDFGTIAKNVPATATFEFTNQGEEAIVIQKVKGSCGCTATAFEQEPILPGSSSEITATYNAKSVGPFTKTVSVYTNQDDEPVVLTISGTVALD